MAQNLLAQSKDSEVSMEQAAAVIIQSLEAAGDKLFSKPGGVRVITADEWADEEEGSDVINRAIENYPPKGG